MDFELFYDKNIKKIFLNSIESVGTTTNLNVLELEKIYKKNPYKGHSLEETKSIFKDNVRIYLFYINKMIMNIRRYGYQMHNIHTNDSHNLQIISNKADYIMINLLQGLQELSEKLPNLKIKKLEELNKEDRNLMYILKECLESIFDYVNNEYIYEICYFLLIRVKKQFKELL